MRSEVSHLERRSPSVLPSDYELVFLRHRVRQKGRTTLGLSDVGADSCGLQVRGGNCHQELHGRPRCRTSPTALSWTSTSPCASRRPADFSRDFARPWFTRLALPLPNGRRELLRRAVAVPDGALLSSRNALTRLQENELHIFFGFFLAPFVLCNLCAWLGLGCPAGFAFSRDACSLLAQR